MARRKKSEDDEPKIGHNSNLNDGDRTKLSGIVEEIERVDAEVRELTSERGTIYKSAKEHGFDTKALKAVIKSRRMEASKREELANTIAAYEHALGMLADLPLGQAALAREFAHP